jgi:hypothetical protein
MGGEKLPILSVEGNKKENFRLWRTRFNDYCIIKQYRDPEKEANEDHYIKAKRPFEIASFRSALPDDVLNTVQYNITPRIVGADRKKPWLWMEELAKHFEGEDTVMADRYSFQEQKQTSQETMAEWETRVRQTAHPLEYGDMQDQVMRDKFIFGLFKSDMRGELLKLKHKQADGSVTALAGAVQQARALEAAQQANKLVGRHISYM